MFSLIVVSVLELKSSDVSDRWFHQLSSSFVRSRSYRTSFSFSSESLKFHTFSGTERMREEKIDF